MFRKCYTRGVILCVILTISFRLQAYADIKRLKTDLLLQEDEIKILKGMVTKASTGGDLEIQVRTVSIPVNIADMTVTSQLISFSSGL